VPQAPLRALPGPRAPKGPGKKNTVACYDLKGEREAANRIIGKVKDDWSTVELLQIGERQFHYRQMKNCSADVVLVLNRFTVMCSTTTVSLPIKTNDAYSCRAKFLANQVDMLLEEGKFVIRQREQRPGRQAGSDSDDEGIPDPEIRPLFTPGEMAVVQYNFDKLKFSYLAVREVGCYNEPGKHFVCQFAEFMLCCRNDMRFTALRSSATGASQPEALFVVWETNHPQLRQSSDDPILSPVEQYADYVVYDTHTEENVVIIEVKTDPDVAVESQNNEQMVGLWGDEQAVMLGLEVKGSIVTPKVLLRIENAMQMMYLQDIVHHSKDGLLKLAKLLVVFMTFVECSSN